MPSNRSINQLWDNGSRFRTTKSKLLYKEVDIKLIHTPRSHNAFTWMLFHIMILTIKLTGSLSLVGNLFWIMEIHSSVSATVSHFVSILLFATISFTYLQPGYTLRNIYQWQLNVYLFQKREKFTKTFILLIFLEFLTEWRRWFHKLLHSFFLCYNFSLLGFTLLTHHINVTFLRN